MVQSEFEYLYVMLLMYCCRLIYVLTRLLQVSIVCSNSVILKYMLDEKQPKPTVMALYMSISIYIHMHELIGCHVTTEEHATPN